ncbi:MAG: Cof-type HAD-IIB family hydrolase [Clostridia bacterium]|nr:Cof-type HAD-IIB family hydrolase [Clostridia bacterium]
MYKLIAIDVDGTLLNCYGEVTQKNKEAVSKALAKGIEIVLASGRMPRAIIPIANEINVNKYIISGNGATIYNVEKDEIVYDNYISKKKILEIIDICEKNSMYYNVYTNNVVLAKSLNYNVLYYHNENRKNPEDRKIKINIINDMYEYIKKYEGNDFLKITICDNDEAIFKGIMNKLKKIKNIDILEVAHMSRKIIKHGSEEFEISYFYTEITNENVNKWVAIKELIKKLEIKEEEVMAIGDNINDKEMILNSGLGIVTGNSSPYMKKIAKEVVSSNDESGVAEAINKHA